MLQRRSRTRCLVSAQRTCNSWVANSVSFQPTAFLACALTLAHLFLAAAAILALPAADSTRFLMVFVFWFAEWPKALAALRIPSNSRCSLLSCFSSFLSCVRITSRIVTQASLSMDSANPRYPFVSGIASPNYYSKSSHVGRSHREDVSQILPLRRELALQI
jgi:hypothetical protein